MAKKKSKTKLTTPSFRTIAIISLIFNALALTTMIVGSYVEKAGLLDYALVNNGIERMCSDQFRQTVEKVSKDRGDSENNRGLQLALLDYPCTKKGAQPFYEKGYNDYAHSLGLKPENP